MTNWFTRKTASHIFLPFLHIYHCLCQASAQHQINLGSFNLQRSPSNGDIQLGLGQAANIFGFGADRQLGFNLGPGRFGARTDNGLLLGGQRFGLDSHLGFQEGRGLDLGNLLSLFQPVVNQFISRRPPPSPPALPTSALSQSRPPQTFASFPEEDGQPNGQAVSGPVMPTLIQPPVQPPDAASGAWIDPNGSTMTTSNQGEQHEKEEFPASVGDGWHSSDEEVEVGKETIEKENSNQGQGEIEPWSLGRTAPQPAGGKRVTTEGQFHGGGKSNVNNGLMERRREGGQQSAHDGNTNTGGEEMKKSKGLPIPEGLEPLKKS